MHFGQTNILNFLKISVAAFSLICITGVSSCNDKNELSSLEFKYPEAGKKVKAGEDVKIALDLPKDAALASISYKIDGKVFATVKDAQDVALKTAGLQLGYRMITALIDHGTTKDSVSVNIELTSGLKPSILKYKVIHTFPHDTSAYTEGLAYHDGRLLESTGETGNSRLKWTDLKTGKVLQSVNIDNKYFGEGSVLIGDKILMLTYKEHMGLVYDAKTLKLLSSFPTSEYREGWGLTFNGEHILNTDGTNRIWFLNKDSFRDEGSLDVYDHNGPVNQLNELEYINGKIYANIYLTDSIAVIDPKTGTVESYIDLKGLLPAKDKFANTDVLNGIAWDEAGKRLFVTGKKWNKLFEIKLVP
ncbi:glutaminyl-peptide cyclotransferase [Pedobacter sp. MC2016-14]|uniref:glutaminyl-peptide cyclotransferase n=1 Tax=Pedobacter sp. MC2016-14 TaxID=2897327 RepID=UPI001E3CCB91|nr:glutaminyl-peptide cyclotransferase [Pedobacter sp. MC2016-14]MCD0486991.1 glutaminyl-peptide cyclotransferase [Pedobacter sp. MC2016-14]